MQRVAASGSLVVAVHRPFDNVCVARKRRRLLLSCVSTRHTCVGSVRSTGRYVNGKVRQREGASTGRCFYRKVLKRQV